MAGLRKHWQVLRQTAALMLAEARLARLHRRMGKRAHQLADLNYIPPEELGSLYQEAKHLQEQIRRKQQHMKEHVENHF